MGGGGRKQKRMTGLVEYEESLRDTGIEKHKKQCITKKGADNAKDRQKRTPRTGNVRGTDSSERIRTDGGSARSVDGGERGLAIRSDLGTDQPPCGVEATKWRGVTESH